MTNRMHCPRYPVPVLLCCAGLWLSPGPLGAEIIYDNTQRNFNNMMYPAIIEYGDEVELGGTGRTVTEFQCEYFGEFVSTGEQTVRVRLYANDGVGKSDLGEFSAPGTLLYESEPQTVYSGFNLISLRGLSVPVTNDFVTWTVEFKGLSGKFPNRAGLTFYDAPTVGASFDDFWAKTASGWTPLRFGGNPKANFSARLTATPDTPVDVSVTALNNGTRHLTILGPAYRNAVLESSQDQTNWTALTQFIFRGTPVEYTDPRPFLDPEPQYRARLLTTPVLFIHANRPATNGFTTLQIVGTPGQRAAIETSSNLVTWTSVFTNHLSSVFADYRFPTSTNEGLRFFRVAQVPEERILFSPVTRLTNGQWFVSLLGPPGRDFVLQTSSNFTTWTAAQTNTFSFTGGVANHPLPVTPEAQKQFYRVLLLPLSF